VVVLILGFANLLADGVSMAVSKYSSDKAEKQRIQRIRRLEHQSIREKPEEEIAEIEEILRDHGFQGKALVSAVNVITHNQDAWVELMMKYEFNVAEEAIYPLRSAVTTFIAFNVIGLIPLLGYLFMPLLQLDETEIFGLTCIFTAIALFVVGAVKSHVTDEAWWKSGGKTLLLGGIAAALAYVVGFVLRDLPNIW
jgi:VIT1/CCC1 family predicted Fe2+/Mn2+ transporter